MQPLYHEQPFPPVRRERPAQDAADLLHEAAERAVHGGREADALALAGVGMALVDLAREVRALRESVEAAGRTA
ncbi:hypothetical protein ACFOWE_18425 [Planomonospora corallina]|uniref:Uncharacterized protein n=1 Tax=Planomonospora corallina TaxID=1806052 RepID=A0ABV8ICQ8_9ACTN